MTAKPDFAEIDAHLEELLELGQNERQLRLEELDYTRPDLAAMVRKVLAFTAAADTLDFAHAGQSLQRVEEQPPPAEIGGYRLLEEIGRGGMAVVYAGVRDVHGSAQRVAIKLLRAAILSPVDRERFLNEQRILARLQHPNIASLIDVGVVGDRPYMVLERIDGVPINQQLSAGHANLERQLDAIERITDALALAHEHFVIHRDIKPGNVLIDSQGHLKLIDFGIAKVLDGADGLGMAPTLTGTAPLTLRYASPEQLGDRPVGVGSDIYQLGLLMFHLLSGGWPFDEAESEVPAQRTQPDYRPCLPSQRAAEPRLKRALQGDLDSIVMRCLAHDPAHRYRSIRELKDDLERYREHRPVQARRHTRAYLLRRFVHRHRLGVALAVASLLLIAVSVYSALSLADRSRLYAQRTERILDTMASLFANANPYAATPGEVSVSQAVSAASERFLNETDPDPLFQVLMLERLADIQSALRDFSSEGALLRKARDLADQNQLDQAVRDRLLVKVGESTFALGEYAEVDRLLSADHGQMEPESAARAEYLRAKLAIERGLNDQALTHFDTLFAALKAHDLPDLFEQSVYNSFGILQRRLGNTDEAIAAYRRAYALLDPSRLDDREALMTIPTNIAIAYGAAGRYAESEREFSTHLQTSVGRLGPDHPQIAILVRNYATLLQYTARFDQAYALLQRYLPAYQASDSKSTQASYLDALSVAALAVGREPESIEHAARGLDLALTVYGEHPREVASEIDRLAWMLFEFGDLDRAARLAVFLVQRDAETSGRIAVILQIGKALRSPALPAGLAIPEPPADSCDEGELVALRAWLVDHRAPPADAIPDGCIPRQRLRMQAMGLTAAPADSAEDDAEPMRSGFMRLAPDQGRSWQKTPSPTLAELVDQVIARLERIPRSDPPAGAAPDS